ncbi:MAG TPA: lipocalin family protein [Chitinophagaceae bacterium]
MKKLIYLIAAMALFSCNKDDDNNPPEITMQSLAGDYMITSAKVNGIDVLDTYLDPCQQDDVYTLQADGTYTITDAGTTCNPRSDTTGTWSLSGNIITIGTQQFTIVNFNGSTIEATTSVMQGPITVPVDVVFTRQ